MAKPIQYCKVKKKNQIPKLRLEQTTLCLNYSISQLLLKQIEQNSVSITCQYYGGEKKKTVQVNVSNAGFKKKYATTEIHKLT